MKPLAQSNAFSTFRAIGPTGKPEVRVEIQPASFMIVLTLCLVVTSLATVLTILANIIAAWFAMMEPIAFQNRFSTLVTISNVILSHRSFVRSEVDPAQFVTSSAFDVVEVKIWRNGQFFQLLCLQLMQCYLILQFLDFLFKNSPFFCVILFEFVRNQFE